MAKVNKNQRTDRLKNRVENKVAKIVVAEKKENGQYRFRSKMVALDQVQAEMKSGRYGGAVPPASAPRRSSGPRGATGFGV